MHSFFLLARIYPFWALPSALVIAELGRYFRRQENPKQYFCWIIVSILMLGFIFWLIYRGDLNSDAWVRSMIG